MVTKSRLRLAIAAEKGIDFKKQKQQKQHKAALKRKSAEESGSAKLENQGDDLGRKNIVDDQSSEEDDEAGNEDGVCDYQPISSAATFLY